MILSNNYYIDSQAAIHTLKASLTTCNIVMKYKHTLSKLTQTNNVTVTWVLAGHTGIQGDEEADLTAPHLFYSRPKGTYKGADTQKVMLDFYLLNTSISADGNKVRATINGTEFMIDEWAPHYIEGLPMGEATIKLELLDAEGNPIPGPFNSVERTVTLSE